ncbi:MAG: hypothetical protein WCF57_15220 [Pyrinomonadaceae bacterium]
MFLPGLMVGILTGLLAAAPLNWQASAPSASDALRLTTFDIIRLSPAELETLALDVLSALHEKRGPVADEGLGAEKGSWNQPADGLRQVHLGIKNARRLLPLAKRLTLESLGEHQKTSGLLREKRLIASVRLIALDPRLGDTAEVWDDNLSKIHIGSEYAASLLSDDEAMLLLGHELTHVAVRSGRLNQFIEHVTEVARFYVKDKPDGEQKEELACDFIGAEVLKHFIALYPTAETNAERFSRAFGYEPPSKRLALAWQDFCASYNGGPPDEEHLSQDQTIRALLGLDPELKALIPDDAISTRLCR